MTERQYTDEQDQLVRKIMALKDFYRVLGVEKTVTEEELKKAYKKVARYRHEARTESASRQEQSSTSRRGLQEGT